MSTTGAVVSSIWAKASGRYATIVIGLWLLTAAVSLVWTPYSLLDTDGFNAWASPSAAHPLGTDGTGADVLSWLMAGSRTNLMIAVLTVWSLVIFARQAHSMRTRPYKSYLYFIWILFFSALPLIPPGRSVGELMLLAVPLAVIIPTCFNRRESTWLGIAYLLLLVSMIAYNLFPVSL